MPRIKSAAKALRQNKRRRAMNVSRKKRLKSALKGGDLQTVYKALDKAAKVNLIKKNKASRLKSRFAKRAAALAKKSGH